MTELLTNGNFETWTTSTNAGTWTEDGDSGDATRSIDQETTNHHSGSSAAKLSTSGNDGSTDFGLYQDITTTAATNYVIQGFLNFETVGTGIARIEVYDNTGTAIIEKALFYTDTNGYIPVRIEFETPASCVSVRLKLYLDDGTTDVLYFDDFSVQTVPAYTTISKIQGRIQAIDSSLTDGQFGFFMDSAYGLIDAVTRRTWSNPPKLIESIATDLAAYYALTFDPSNQTDNSEASLLSDMLWANIDRNLGLMLDTRILNYLKGLE